MHNGSIKVYEAADMTPDSMVSEPGSSVLAHSLAGLACIRIRLGIRSLYLPLSIWLAELRSIYDASVHNLGFVITSASLLFRVDILASNASRFTLRQFFSRRQLRHTRCLFSFGAMLVFGIS
jgi:hypothetical protein